MAKKKTIQWVAVLSSSLAVAVFTFVANKAWDTYHHHKVGPKYVDTALRFEDKKLLLFVRNNSDDPLDLTQATIDLNAPELVKNTALGAYPDVSKVYDVSASSGSATLEAGSDGLAVKLKITQVIAPKGADQFAVSLVGLTGPIDLSNVKIHAEIKDVKGNTYVVVP